MRQTKRSNQPSLFKQFYENLKSPRKASVFRFLRIGHNLLYAFFLTLLAALFFSPTMIKATLKVGQSFSFIFLPFAIIYYYIVLTFLFFSFVSLLALLGYWCNRIFFKRRVNGQQAWSVSVNAATWPTFLFSLITLFKKIPSIGLFVYMGIVFLLFIIMVQAIPKPKPTRSTPSKT